MRVAAIFGPGASQRDLQPFDSNLDTEWLFTISPDAAAVLIFGGDGTVHRHLRPLVESKIPLLVVPRGSGNDFARALGIRKNQQAIAAWRQFAEKRDNVKSIDAGSIKHAVEAPAPRQASPGDTLFCCVAGVGLDSEVAEAANRLPRWLRARGGYVLSLLRLLPKFAAMEMRISTSNSGAWEAHSSGLMMLAAFANTPDYGAGMRIAPRARLDDGQLDACLIHGMDNLEAFCLFPTIYFGKHLAISKVDYFQTTRALIATQTPLNIYADGEFVCTTPAEISILPKALRVIIPVSPA